MDGIHLDYIRYPESWNVRVSREKGRKFITRIVEAIHRSVKREKPWVKMSCSPIGKFDDLGRYWSHGWNAYTKVCQDAQGWLKSGLMDELYPMMYFATNSSFRLQSTGQNRVMARLWCLVWEFSFWILRKASGK